MRMNRLTNHWKAAKLARLLLDQAAEDAEKGKTERALKHLIGAVREILVDMNNVSSIAFKQQPKK
jgi:hypothetical protein